VIFHFVEFLSVHDRALWQHVFDPEMELIMSKQSFSNIPILGQQMRQLEDMDCCQLLRRICSGSKFM